MTDTASLIARLEKATGPDRELDVEIHTTVIGLEMYESVYTRGDGSVCLRYWAGGGDSPSYYVLPRYTSSIDAAMTLVSPDWRVNSADFSVDGRFSWMLTLTGQPRTDWFARRRTMMDDTGDDDPLHMTGVGKTLPTALCIAALRAARMGIAGDGVGEAYKDFDILKSAGRIPQLTTGAKQ